MNQGQWREWLASESTQEFLALADEEIAACKDNLGSPSMAFLPRDELVQRVCQNNGAVKGIVGLVERVKELARESEDEDA